MTNINSNPIYGQYDAIKKLDKNNDGKLDKNELKSLADKNGKITRESMSSKGIDETAIQKIVIQSNEQDQSASLIDIEDRLTTKFFEGMKDYTGIRSVMNKVIDKNNDGKLQLSEVKAFTLSPEDQKKLKAKVQEFGRDDELVDDSVRAFKIAVKRNSSLDSDEAKSKVIIDGTSWKSFMRFEGDSGKDLKPLQQKDQANQTKPTEKYNQELKTVISKLQTDSANDPKINKLLETLKNNNMQNLENINYISKFLELHNKEGLANISEKLDNFINNDKSQLPIEKKLELSKDILHDLSYISDIDQKNKGTCAAASIQMKLAFQNPDLYTDICTNLAEGKKFKLPDGSEMKPNKTFETDKEDKRTFSCKVMQNAFMEFGRESKEYNSNRSADKAQDGVSSNNAKYNDGMKNTEIDKLSKSVFSGKEQSKSHGLLTSKEAIGSKIDSNTYKIQGREISGRLDKDLYKEIEDDLSKGRMVSFSVDGHQMTITGIDKNVSPPSLTVNSWGKQFSITADNLIKVLKGVETSDDEAAVDKGKIESNQNIILGS